MSSEQSAHYGSKKGRRSKQLARARLLRQLHPDKRGSAPILARTSITTDTVVTVATTTATVTSSSSSSTVVTRSHASTSAVASASAQDRPSAAKDVAHDTDIGATTRKFALRQFGEPAEDVCIVQGVECTYCPMQLASLTLLVRGLACPECGERDLFVSPDDKTDGLVVRLSTMCAACDAVITTAYSSDRLPGDATPGRHGKTGFTVNRRVVAAMLSMGKGYAGLRKLCQMLDMPCLTESSFQQQQRSVIDAVQTASSDILARAVSIVREVYCGLDPSLSDSDVIDIPVSYDGSWMTRGHTSNIGIGAVVDLLTGLVVDFAVMSRYCHGCQVTGSRLKGADYEAWKAAHQCDKNYTGSAGMMEVVAAEQIWKRSVATNKLRYTTMLSDGDSKSFTNLNSLIASGDLYDSDHPIEKEECVNHVC